MIQKCSEQNQREISDGCHPSYKLVFDESLTMIHL